MANLTKDTPRVYEYAGFTSFGDIDVAAGTNGVLFEGSAVAQGGSTGATFISGSNDAFAGFVEAKCDNTGGGALAIKVRLREKGIVKLAVTGVASGADVGSTVYATDTNTFTKTATSACPVGKVHRWITSTTCMVVFEAASVRSI